MVKTTTHNIVLDDIINFLTLLMKCFNGSLERLSELVTREMDIGRLLTERAKKTATLEAIQKNIMEYKQNISSEFQGTFEDLEKAIQNFKNQSR